MYNLVLRNNRCSSLSHIMFWRKYIYCGRALSIDTGISKRPMIRLLFTCFFFIVLYHWICCTFLLTLNHILFAMGTTRLRYKPHRFLYVWQAAGIFVPSILQILYLVILYRKENYKIYIYSRLTTCERFFIFAIRMKMWAGSTMKIEKKISSEPGKTWKPDLFSSERWN